MDRLRDACILLFARENPARLLDGLSRGDGRVGGGFEEAMASFVKLGMGEPAMGWHAQVGMEALGKKVEEDWGRPKRDGVGEDESGWKSPFHVLARAAEPLILNYDFEPRVKHRHMLRWRKLSFEVTGDLLLCAHLAWSDRFQTKQRRFQWPHQPKTDNRRLEGMLARGMSENHAHLHATAPVFEANWLALMTAPLRHQEALKKWDDQPLHAPAQHDGTSVYSVRASAALAAALRFELWCELDESDKRVDNSLRMNQEWRQGIREMPSLYYADVAIQGAALNRKDYVVTSPINKAPVLVRGERTLLYRALHRVYSEKSPRAFQAKLQAYLLLKHRVRRELVQLNDRLGFGNFKFYQDRKNQIIEVHDELHRLAVAEALAAPCVSERGGSLEFRIGPRETMAELKRYIEWIASAFDESKLTERYQVRRDLTLGNGDALQRLRKGNIFFTLHFFKEEDQLPEEGLDRRGFQAWLPVRHEQLRKKVARQARAIMELRASEGVWAKLIRGIDAASTEFITRPEVFAPAFRLLRRYPYSIPSMPVAGGQDVDRLRVTFHAGEDFFCLTDGMRYVEEAIRLLEFQDGDRIGHGLALGLDARKYFELKKWEVLLPKQELLDNMTWILWVARMNDIDLPASLEGQIQELKTRLFSELFEDSCRLMGMDALQHYEWSYLLRGDDPSVYLLNRNDDGDSCTENRNTASDRFLERVFFPDADYPEVWKGDDPKWDVKLDRLRRLRLVRDLVCAYHQDPKVRREGRKMTRFVVPPQLAQVLTQIQERIMALLQKHHIAIECNPSSNVLISPVERYIEHPILRFYNRELLAPNDGIAHGLPPSPQLLVSINTDDAGIFGTSLETEYALMARALEKRKDAEGRPVFKPSDVYAWLDKVRLMGMDLSFRDRENGSDELLEI